MITLGRKEREIDASSLTKQSNRLIALAGVAKEFALLCNYDVNAYFAGHWRQALPRSLLWQTSASQNVTLDTTYIAPSWSWAYDEGKVKTIRTISEWHKNC